jgi:hypothetical protein
MGTEPGSNIRNDSDGATAVNTMISWTRGEKPLDGRINAHIEGLTAYAKNQATIAANLMDASSQVDILAQLPVEATGKGGFPEGVYVRGLLARNASELMSFLGHLTQTFQNTGSAAQTVADSIGSTDTMSAIIMNQVNFALADPDAQRPAGLNPGIGKTYAQALAEQQRQQVPGPSADVSGSHTTVTTGVVAGGAHVGNQQTVVTTTALNGDKTVAITVQTGPGASITHTTVTVDGVRTTSSSTSTTVRGDRETTTTTKNEDDSEIIDTTTDSGSETTATFDRNGAETSVNDHAPEAAAPGIPSPQEDPYTRASQTAASQLYTSPW